jgi:S1-C subfamily serine protease
MQRWKQAVIHLEGAASSIPMHEMGRAAEAMWKAQERGDRAEAEAQRQILLQGRDRRVLGSAVFLRYKASYYLVTARHVVTDETLARRELEDPLHPPIPETMQERIDNWIFNIIFRVPSLAEIRSAAGPHYIPFLMSLGSGPRSLRPYIFSSAEIDLALIALEGTHSTFAENLLNVGYEPITVDDIADGPSQEGAEVFSVGYPTATAVRSRMTLDPAVANWASSAISVPVYSFGHIAMVEDTLPFFWCDISIYPGSSGGPLVESDKLVGIISGQAEVDRGRIPFAAVTPARHIRQLLTAEDERQEYIQYLGLHG